MKMFATEFPVRPVADRASFVAQVLAWLRGTKYSTVLDDRQDTDLDRETAYLRSANGEELRLREFGKDGVLEAIGFRHDFPDDLYRLWRTEVVLKKGSALSGQDIMRLRTQCIARGSSAKLELPRKPFIIKSFLSDGWGGVDGILNIIDQPYWLNDDEGALDIAKKITFGGATTYLPVVYISAIKDSSWMMSKSDIEKLAYDLGGIAHVVVEPTRNFSVQLRDQTDGLNVYRGVVGLSLPRRPIFKRISFGFHIKKKQDFLNAIKASAYNMRSHMPADGWDWTELQEQALRMQRQRDRNRLSATENEQLLEEEIENLKEKIAELNQRVSGNSEISSESKRGEGIFTEEIDSIIGDEIYPGEFSDRIRYAAKIAIEKGDQVGIDGRSKFIFERIVSSLPKSPALSEFVEDLRRATKDPKRMAIEVAALLSRHGYRQKAEKNHLRLEPKEEFGGLESVTVAKTPSENRGLQNTRKQIERAMGIPNLQYKD